MNKRLGLIIFLEACWLLAYWQARNDLKGNTIEMVFGLVLGTAVVALTWYFMSQAIQFLALIVRVASNYKKETPQHE